MTKPRQLNLPFDSPQRGSRSASPMLEDIIHRLVRMESRLVQLMKHQGMATDGRSPIVTEAVEPVKLTD